MKYIYNEYAEANTEKFVKFSNKKHLSTPKAEKRFEEKQETKRRKELRASKRCWLER